MIKFRCIKCSRQFTVPDSYSGRRAKCKGCGAELRVPQFSQEETPAPAAAAKPPMRVRRLLADAELMKQAFAKNPNITIRETEGSPPDIYHIEFRVKGLERNAKGKPVPRESHLVEVQLGADYPRLPPVCKMLTPIFHPNIDTTHICIGDHWTAGERLVDLVTRIAEMIAYQAYNIRSPLDGEAAMWADLNAKNLPVDPRPMTA